MDMRSRRVPIAGAFGGLRTATMTAPVAAAVARLGVRALAKRIMNRIDIALGG